jgi:hypothetical protein
MSRRANPTLADVAEWFEPGSSNRVVLEYWTLLVQHLVSIKRAPLGFRERLWCCAVLVPSWTRYWRRQLQKELVSLPAELRRVRAARRRGAT